MEFGIDWLSMFAFKFELWCQENNLSASELIAKFGVMESIFISDFASPFELLQIHFS